MKFQYYGYMNPKLEMEIRIARTAAIIGHAGQFRRDGDTPYYTHPEVVAYSVSDEAKPAAWLHDLKEDNSNIGVGELFIIGLSEQTVDAVVLLTKIEGEDYFEYIKRIKNNKIAREVKIADISHNLASSPKEKNIIKYNKALEILKSI